MATSLSRDDIVEAYESLLTLEQSLKEHLDQAEEPSPETLNEILERETELMDLIEEAPELDREVRRDEGTGVDDVFSEFAELREENRERIEQYASELENTMESLEQAHELLKHYLQGEPRSNEETIRRIDREV